MNKNYTQYNSDSIYSFMDEDGADKAMDFLRDPDNFRAFHQGLSEIMIKKEYACTDTSPNEMARVLSKKLQEIGSPISLTTVISWFTGEHRPKIEAGYRKQIYEICFALNLSFEETIWFFNHVYYDRAFNCHTIDESVFYFCFKNGMSYKDALTIIDEVEQAPATSSSAKKYPNYTLFVKQRVEDIKSKEELISFLVLNKENFSTWNETAYALLDNLVNELLPSENAKNEIEKIKRKIKLKNTTHGILPEQKNQKEWGLIMKEIAFEFPNETFLEMIEKKNIRSKNFLLETILGLKQIIETDKERFIDKMSIPDVVKANFPSRKTLSDVLSESKVTQSKSYDSIRKTILLLEFYRFWCEIKIATDADFDDEIPLSDVFFDEMNATLQECGYEELYAGNPFDWIIMCSAQADDPLWYFRECMSMILLNERTES
ncbi:MAG: hypothetical protein IJZ55_03890 [Lachnospiraceae bacterium]|nr:hypothetical protein [Lachnospiraceae bacterium]